MSKEISMPNSRSISTLFGKAVVLGLILFATHGTEPSMARAAADAPAEPDNTGRNVRDRDGTTLTPLDQGTSQGDIERTRQIRDAITSDHAMSMQARNAKVITREGVVTLRGPVANQNESAAIEAIARKTGATQVDNQLEIDKE